MNKYPNTRKFKDIDRVSDYIKRINSYQFQGEIIGNCLYEFPVIYYRGFRFKVIRHISSKIFEILCFLPNRKDETFTFMHLSLEYAFFRSLELLNTLKLNVYGRLQR